MTVDQTQRLSEMTRPTITHRTIASFKKEEPPSDVQEVVQPAGEQQASDTDDSLTELRAQQASKRPFPPGCPVLCVNGTTISKGTVERIFIDITSLSRSFVYHVNTKEDTVVAAHEEQLQWAPGCPVWVYPTPGPIWKECTILTTYQKFSRSGTVFSLQQDSDGSLHHGYPKEFIRYRGSAEPPLHAPVTTQANEEWYEPNPITKVEQVATQNEPASDAMPPLAQDKANVVMPSLSNKPDDREPPSGARPERYHHETTDNSLSNGDLSTTVAVKRTAVERIENSPKRVKRTLQGRFEPAPQVSKQIIAPPEMRSDETRQDSSASLSEQTKQSQVIATRSFLIPECIFRCLDQMKDFQREHCHKIMTESGCQIRLFTKKVKGNDRMWFELTGTQEQRLVASRHLEESLASNAGTNMKERALYCLAWLNGESIDKIVHQYHCISKRKLWMFSRRLPRDFSDFDALFIGCRGHNKKQIERQTGCILSLNIKCEDPHFVIYGDTVDKVRKCIQLTNSSFNEFRERQKQNRTIARQHHHSTRT